MNDVNLVLPTIGRKVLVKKFAGGFEVLHLAKRGYLTLDGGVGMDAAWCPGDLPICNSVNWTELPE